MTESMIERVARAIQDIMPDWLEGDASDEDLARAAIEALRDVTEPMEEVGLIAISDNCVIDSGELFVTDTCAESVFRAMLDAALTPDSKE
jgi:hypothetical protein